MNDVKMLDMVSEQLSDGIKDIIYCYLQENPVLLKDMLFGGLFVISGSYFLKKII